MNKLNSLAKFLEVSKEKIKVSSYDNNVFETDDAEYLVLTDKEANKYAKDSILESAWAFNTWFILDNLNSKFKDADRDTLEEIIKLAQEKCEGGNDIILGMITKRSFVDEAIQYDGRGHFLSSYDGEESEQDNYYIYRTN